MRRRTTGQTIHPQGRNFRLDGGERIGPSDAPLQVVEFGDFQCPFCATFHRELERVMDEYPGKVSLVFYNLPLIAIHARAEEAARAGLCGAAVGRFRQMASTLYDSQEAFHVLEWESLAESAGIDDVEAFLECMSDGRVASRVESEAALAKELGIGVTPTLIFNGWRWTGALPADSIRRMVTAAVAGEPLYPSR